MGEQMTPLQFLAARKTLGLSQNDLAGVWGMGDNGGRTIRRWENGERPLNPVAAFAIQGMIDAQKLEAALDRKTDECLRWQQQARPLLTEAEDESGTSAMVELERRGNVW